MEKTKKITEKEMLRINVATDKKRVLKNIIGIKGKYNLGDTAVKIDKAEKYTIYKNNWGGRDFYYLVVNVLDEELAFAYSLYPIS